ncbi:tuberin-like [Clytia hemisphaerica]|uniref:Rap-GAP domain-containing protein n=1 Tax=Clytia hemisphaerica TaxID=252671 RepID=A0A7M5UIW7_9CNID
MSKQMKGKFKSMFGKKPSGAPFDKESCKSIITREILKDIDRSQPILQRIRNLKELSEVVTVKVMEEHEIEALLFTVNDLLDKSISGDGRQAALQFLIAITNGQNERLGILRSHIFRVIVEHDVQEDLQFRIALLKVLTDDGKKLDYCEQIGPFLDGLMEEALDSPNAVAFLEYLVKIVHYHSSFLDKSIVCSIVSKTCDFCNNANGEQDIESSLLLLDATVRYGGLPAEGLLPLIETLCRTVNIERFCQSSWKLMRNLIGTKLGHTAVFIMCQILEDNHHILDVILLRGAVFFIGMSIWGSKRVASLRYSPLHVLSSFKVCLQCNHHLVAHEVVLSLQRLVKKFGEEQEIITWDILMDIVENILHMIDRGDADKTSILFKQTHELLTNTEALYVEEKFYGSAERFFKILTNCAKDRPEESISTILGYYEDRIDPNTVEWSDIFEQILITNLKQETRSGVKVRVLETIKNIYSRYRHRHEDDILSYILHGHVSDMVYDNDKDIRKSVGYLLSYILKHCCADKYPEVLKVVAEFLSYISLGKDVTRFNVMEDISIVVDALINTFESRLFEPSNIYIVGMLEILIKHLNDHFTINITSIAAGKIRRKIFELLLALRSNEYHFLGIKLKENGVKFSTHAIFKPLDSEIFNNSASRPYFVDFDFQQAFEGLLKCLKNELDWNVLELVLKSIVKQLEDKNLYVYCQCNMNKLCAVLCTIINDKTFFNKMKNVPTTMTMSELRNLIFPILSTLSTYHSYLVKDRQVELLTSIEFGLQTRSALTCVSCLTVCVLEMQGIMKRILPSMLVKLSQIASSEMMSNAILKFLSTLKEIPSLYSNFVEEQYMSIFAMALPYTDCLKYTRYIVTLAHQVIADWFTRCKLMFRKDFVSIIVAALKSHTTEKDERDSMELQKDMTDVCLDMMARYSFSLHRGQPKRSALVDFLLSQGSSQTWLVGNMLVTVTTSNTENEQCDCYKWKNKKYSMDLDSSGNGFKFDHRHQRPHYHHEVNEDSRAESSTKPINLTKLTQKIVEQNNSFSPSEKLLFSRQGSKAVDGIIEDDEESESGSEHAEDEHQHFILNDQSNEEEHQPIFYPDNPPLQKENSENTQNLPLNGRDDVMKKQHDKEASPTLRPPRSSNVSLTPPSPTKIDCYCVCSGWAEIVIQRPTGKISWLMKLENRELMNLDDFSDLLLLRKSLERENTPSISESLKSTDSEVWKQSQGSDTSSTNSFRNKRRFSTGSIDDSILQQLETSPVLPIKRTVPTIKIPEKRALTKTLSHPSHVLPTTRQRSSSFNTVVNKDSNDNKDSTQTKAENFWSPNFVFLQLFYSSFGNVFENAPILLDQTEAMQRTIKILHKIPAFNTHKFGVLYVGQGQENSEIDILENDFGSIRYTNFLAGLGEIISLSNSTEDYYTGGLSPGEDGKFACVWKDDTTQVIFHVATLMPFKTTDTKCISKKRHIGNDFVTIIYDDSENGYSFGTIKGQFNYAEIVIRPVEYANNVVYVRLKQNSKIICLNSQTISDSNLAILVRQMAIHTNMALVTEKGGEKTTNAFASNWLQRLRQIKRIRTKVDNEANKTLPNDFTIYT